MYKRFYGLERSPFNLSPDPLFYYPTARHNEAIASLECGILQRKGFSVLTGEVGTGKTLLVRYLIEILVSESVNYAYVFNPRMQPDDFLRYVIADFEIEDPKSTRGEMLQQFNRFLLDVNARGGTAALLIDEAHLLTPELLEEVRLLTNIETSEHKLLQIVLVGQPELDAVLDSPELRQLKQRIALRCQLQALDRAEVAGYVIRRLEMAGCIRANEIFSRAALDRVSYYSRGIPRLINAICDSAMINAYARQDRAVCRETIEETAADLRLTRPGDQPDSMPEASSDADTTGWDQNFASVPLRPGTEKTFPRTPADAPIGGKTK